MSTENKLGKAFPWIMAAWVCNLIALLFCVWGCEYMVSELGMSWVREPQGFCITMFSLTKFVNTFLLIPSFLSKFGVQV